MEACLLSGPPTQVFPGDVTKLVMLIPEPFPPFVHLISNTFKCTGCPVVQDKVGEGKLWGVY